MNTSELFQSLGRLKDEWLQTRRGQGGLVALSGFEFQLSAALLEMVKAGPSGRVFTEALSDMVQLDDGLLVTQVKRSLTSGAMISALSELWQVEKLAQQVAPEVQSKLRYRILASRRSLLSWEETLRNWSCPDEDGEAVSRFKEKIRAEVSPSVRLEAARLLAAQYHDTDPLMRVERWIGRLMVAAGSGELDRAGEEIAAELLGLAQNYRDEAHRWGIWGFEDVAPDAVAFEPDERRAVRIGERLSVLDLREGRIAKRGIYAHLHDAAEAWLSEADASLARYPIFWIEGRSGAGKSAALLYLLANMCREDPDRVILWLGSRPERVREAMAWARPLMREGRQIILAVDDPCTADRQDTFVAALEDAMADWEALLGSSRAPGLVMPVLVCCGPTEQRAVAEDLAASTARIATFALPNEADEDLEELAAWYRLRTGRPAPTLHGDVLLVQRFFEWTKGRIREFAMRFRERLHDLYPGQEPVLFDLVAKILAFGRLYVDYPLDQIEAERAADPHLAAAMIRLVDAEAHFSLGDDEHRGVRFTHPHLADAIYREWFGRPSDQPFRRRHLVDGLSGIVDDGEQQPAQRLAPLWAIARMAQGGQVPDAAELAERLALIRPELGVVLSDLFRQTLNMPEPLANMPVWVLLEDRLALSLHLSPRELLMKAIGAAHSPSRGLRLSCHILLAAENAGDGEQAVAIVVDLLARAASWQDGDLPWFEWPWLALDVLRRVGPEPFLDTLESLVARAPFWRPLGLIMPELAFNGEGRVRSLVLSWLESQQTWALGWTTTMLRLYKVAEPSDALNKLALSFLRTRPEPDGWGFIFVGLARSDLAGREELIRLGQRWLGLPPPFSNANDGSPAFDRVLRQTIDLLEGDEAAAAPLYERGRVWLENVDDNGGWSYVWSLLWDRFKTDDGAKDRLGLIGVRWLKRIHPEHRGWWFVWHPLVRAAEGDARSDLISHAAWWLESVAVGHRGWPLVLETFVELADVSGLQRIWPVVERNLSRAFALDPTTWARVFGSAANLNSRLERRHDEAIFALGLRWLEGNESSPRWNAVFGAVLSLGLAKEEVRRLASLRSARRGQTAEARMRALLNALNNSSRSVRPELVDMALPMLGSELECPAWPSLWMAVARPSSEDQRPSVITLAQDWLNEVRDPLSWRLVWAKLYHIEHEAVTDARVQVGSELWLEEPVELPSAWLRVWFSHARRADLLARREVAAMALKSLGALSKSRIWPALWIALFDAKPGSRGELRELGGSWLEMARAESAIKYEVRHRIAEGVPPAPLVVPEQALRWLTDPRNCNDPDWTRVLLESRGQVMTTPHAVVANGLTRLRSNWDLPTWAAEWRMLYGIAPDTMRGDLVEVGLSWLPANAKPSDAWASLWHRLVKLTDPASSQRQSLYDLAAPWLATLDRESLIDRHAAGWVRSVTQKEKDRALR